MTSSQITGSNGGIYLSSATYADPVTVDSGAVIYGAGGTNGLAAGVYWTIANYGSIGSNFGSGISLGDGGVVINGQSGSISGYQGVYIGGAAGTVINSGGITGYSGVVLNSGTVDNEAGGSIAGVSTFGVKAGYGVAIDNAGVIQGGQIGAYLASGSVTNTGTGTISGGYDGVEVTSGSATVVNSGRIAGGYYGVLLAGGTVINSGTIQGGSDYDGVLFATVAGTLENAGSISGGLDAVYFGAHSGANRLIVDAGARFSGVVKAYASATNTIELTSSASAGTLSGLGSEYVGFQNLTIDSGAAWRVTGTEAGLEATSFSGFNHDDSLYITNLSYAPGATATLSGGTLAVVSGGTTIDIAMSNVTGTNFYAHDVGGEVLINESTVACYCRGTLILTSRGKVPVEDLAVGDLLVTLSGALKPLKWIGRRSYAGWLAVGNPDAQPVLFKAGALADNVPSRDLLVSPEHAMYLDGALIPARHLVNGVSIIQTKGMEEIHYFHLELEKHAVIFAEDAASETYVDDGNRFMFHNVYDYFEQFPDAPRSPYALYCAPRIEDGFELDAVQRVLNARAHSLRPDGTAAPAPELRGHLDRVTRTLVEGWAFGPDSLAILDNGAVIGRVFPDANHRFRFAMPTGFWREVRHEIEVRREGDWTLLPGSGAVLEPEGLAA